MGAVQQYCISCRFSCSDKAEYFKRQELPKAARLSRLFFHHFALRVILKD